ncbi:hypothetical protein BOKEGFJH_00474 [Chlamydia avium]|uniref:Biopterin-dependent aromatic amino acid hydroxylase family protein n=1 Tax=Chlamydia avium TaxID=1457141 RepID=A0ABP2X764_9CHLA|nr:hypothetical protein [Chlamydia avium]EPP38246.1 biopterin-dependent aromatic amino acid hydroxylase family protein [Chlamydia avium]VVT42948.1 hypothetical protein BOKEGFJH_00474 [Chlamydia avium]
MVHLLSSAISEATPYLPHFIRSRMPLWLAHCPRIFLEYLEQLHLGPELSINLPHILQMIKMHAGFSLYAAPSLVSPDQYLALLHQRAFPVATCLRSLQCDDFSLFPDIIHDLFCHVPWLLHQEIVDFFINMGELFIKAVQRARALYPVQEDYLRILNNNISAMTRICWFTVENGLIKEKGHTKVYGAAILSSTRELTYVFKNNSFISPLNIELIIQRPFYTSTLQSAFFIIRDFYELYEISEMMHLFLEQGRLDCINSDSHYMYYPDTGQSTYEFSCS